MTLQKILTLESLASVVDQYQRSGKSVALCHGCFDWLHPGHAEHFEEARTFADILVVTITPDRFIRKGAGRPFFTEETRLRHLAALQAVDHVALNSWPTACETIMLVRPDFFVKGRDYAPSGDAAGSAGYREEIAAAEHAGARVVITHAIKHSSSSLIESWSALSGPAMEPHDVLLPPLDKVDDSWCITQDRYVPDEESYQETIFSLSNGALGIRPSIDPANAASQPGAFYAGIYGRGLAVPQELVNGPNWLELDVYAGPHRINLLTDDILRFRRVLDMRGAILTTDITVRDQFGQITSIHTEILLHACNAGLGLQSGWVRAENHDRPITLVSWINYRQGNGYFGGTEPAIRTQHMELLEATHDVRKGLHGLFRTRFGDNTITLRSKLLIDGETLCTEYVMEEGRVGERIIMNPAPGRTLHFGRSVGAEFAAAGTTLCRIDQEQFDLLSLDSFPALIRQHRDVWIRSWERSDLKIEGDAGIQQGMRFGIFNLLQHAPSTSEILNIPARGWTSEYHSGHIFFNSELYKIPYYCWTAPDIARGLLLHRHHTLPAAREYAERTGYRGARYPEESDQKGYNAAPFTLHDHQAGRTFTEWSGNEVVHISADVAYAVLTYCRVTNDWDFMDRFGLEMMAEIARFGESLLKIDPGTGRAHIHSVMGPDEYHYHVDDNYYTNYMVAWSMREAARVIRQRCEEHPELYCMLAETTGLSPDDLNRWEDLAATMYYTPVDDAGVREQFGGYFGLPDQQVDCRDISLRPGLAANDIERARYLERFETRLVKQADILMLMYLMPEAFSRKELASNLEYYERRTIHESSLSEGPFGVVAGCVKDGRRAVAYLRRSAGYNLRYEPRRSYRNGVHIAGYAGAWLIVARGMAGLHADGTDLHITPWIPEELASYEFNFTWRNCLFLLRVDHQRAALSILEGNPDYEARILCRSERIPLKDLAVNVPMVMYHHNHQPQETP